MAKFDKQSLCQKYFFGMTLLHAHAHSICIVCAKYQKASVKALVQVDVHMYALSKHKPCQCSQKRIWVSIMRSMPRFYEVYKLNY